MPLTVLVVDDEPVARRHLCQLLAEQPGVQVVAEASDGLTALQACGEYLPDLVLLDISMPGVDGLEAARHLAAFDPRPAVIFCTAYDTHALSAFEAAAIDYLIKPVCAERLVSAIARARTYLAGRIGARTAASLRTRTHLYSRLRGSVRLIPLEEVHYLHAEEKYVVVHHVRGEDLIEESLKSLEEEFPGRFLRIHRNCLIARHELIELRRVGNGQVKAILRHAPAPLDVSRRCLPALRATVKLR